jgi:hypothetical protein
MDGQIVEVLHKAIDEAAVSTGKSIWYQQPSIFRGSQVKLTWQVFMHIALYVATKHEPELRRHLPLHLGCAQTQTAASFATRLMKEAMKAFGSFRGRLSPVAGSSGSSGKPFDLEDVLAGFVDWRNLAKERLEPNAIFEDAAAGEHLGGRGWSAEPPSIEGESFWWIKEGSQLRKQVQQFLQERRADGSTQEAEFDQVVVEQLLPAVSAAITPALLLQHIEYAQGAVGDSNVWFERCLRVVQRTKMSAASPPVWPSPEAAEQIDRGKKPTTKAAKSTAAQLRAELGGMKLSALKRRAEADGVDEISLEEADDADDIKSTVIDLILAKQA